MSKRVRCAIYTRKSTEEGLEQEFNSLDAQREACEAYIQSQRGQGWVIQRKRYDDGGISGGTMHRPALQDLLADIGKGEVDLVVVYKVDRLTRSLTDFARIIETFDARGVSFVSVTQQFNTANSMGRLTLHVLLSFAQFEREVTAERIRDKIAASKKKGMWMGGPVPLGYDVNDRRLVATRIEADTVNQIFRLYVELGTVRRLQDELDRLGIVTKRRVHKTGKQTGGKPFSRGNLYQLLSNPIYIGRIPHKGEAYPGEHDAIVELDTWQAAYPGDAESPIPVRKGYARVRIELLSFAIQGHFRRISPEPLGPKRRWANPQDQRQRFVSPDREGLRRKRRPPLSLPGPCTWQAVRLLHLQASDAWGAPECRKGGVYPPGRWSMW